MLQIFVKAYFLIFPFFSLQEFRVTTNSQKIFLPIDFEILFLDPKLFVVVVKFILEQSSQHSVADKEF